MYVTPLCLLFLVALSSSQCIELRISFLSRCLLAHIHGHTYIGVWFNAGRGALIRRVDFVRVPSVRVAYTGGVSTMPPQLQGDELLQLADIGLDSPLTWETFLKKSCTPVTK